MLEDNQTGQILNPVAQQNMTDLSGGVRINQQCENLFYTHYFFHVWMCLCLISCVHLYFALEAPLDFLVVAKWELKFNSNLGVSAMLYDGLPSTISELRIVFVPFPLSSPPVAYNRKCMCPLSTWQQCLSWWQGLSAKGALLISGIWKCSKKGAELESHTLTFSSVKVNTLSHTQ